MPTRHGTITGMIQVSHNVYASPASIDIIRFEAASWAAKTSKDASMAELQVICGTNTLVAMTFDQNRSDAFNAARLRMAELIALVDEFDATAFAEEP